MFELSFFSVTCLTATLGLLVLALTKPTETYKYLQRKRYQYDVTLALYMLTPKEQFVFNSILFITVTLLLIAACLYLPEHICIIASRMYYYCFGSTELGDSLRHLSSTIMGTATGAKGNASAVVQQVVESVESVGRKTSGDAAREVLGMN